MRYFIEASVTPAGAEIAVDHENFVWRRAPHNVDQFDFCEECRESPAWGWLRAFDGKTLCDRCLRRREEVR
jgi:hypothetical protein